MFGWFQARPVQCFAYEDDVLYVQSASPLSVGSSLKLRAELPVRAGDEPLSAELKLKLLAALPLNALFEKRLQTCFGQVLPHIYSGSLQAPLDYAPLLARLLDPLPQPQELRTAPRATRRLRVTSRDLPNFRGTVMDLSEGGLGMLVDAVVERGRLIQFEVDFEEHSRKPIGLKGKVCWCRPEPGAAFRIGVQFEDLSPALRLALQSVVQGMLSAEPGVIDNDTYLR